MRGDGASEPLARLASSPWKHLAFAGAALLGAIAVGRGLTHRHAPTSANLPTGGSALELHVPRAQGSITLDGDTDDLGWRGPTGRVPTFFDADGNEVRPHSEARFVWGDGHLYVELYAADQDIRATHETADGPVWDSDSFHLVFDDGATERSFDVSPLGTLTDGRRPAHAPEGAARPFDYTWNSGAHLSHELDGTANKSSDEDEEWVIEMAIPFESLGLEGKPGERVGLRMRRCDLMKSGARSCGSWGDGAARGVLVLD